MSKDSSSVYSNDSPENNEGIDNDIDTFYASKRGSQMLGKDDNHASANSINSVDDCTVKSTKQSARILK